MKTILSRSLLPAIMCFAVAEKGAGNGGGGTATAGGAPAAKGAPAPSPAPGASPAAQPQAKTTPEPQPHPKLLAAITKYDEHIQEAETYYVEMIELVLTEKISRADVVATLMKARKVTFETAQSQYSRMKKMWEKPEILEQLKKGEITLRVARDATTKKQANPASTGDGSASGAPGSTGTKSQETKEARYERVRKAHVAAVKECGFDFKSSMLSFEADLKAAGIK